MKTQCSGPWRFSVTCKYTQTSCRTHELSGQSLSSEDTCWADVEQHVEPPRPEFNDKHETKRTDICESKQTEKSGFLNRRNVTISWFYKQLVFNAISVFTFEAFELMITWRKFTKGLHCFHHRSICWLSWLFSAVCFIILSIKCRI